MNGLNMVVTDKGIIENVVNRYMRANYSHLTGDNFEWLNKLLMHKSLCFFEDQSEYVTDRDLDRWVFETIANHEE